MAMWHCVVGGQQYGPVDETTLAQWAQEGRLKATDSVWSEGMAQWQPAGTVLPNLFAALSAAPPPPPMAAGQPGSALKPHRGGMILAFGILGIFCCTIFAILAWVMGSADLKEMRAGQMDPAGQGTTNAGKILGIIAVALACIGIVAQIIMVLTRSGHYSYRFGSY